MKNKKLYGLVGVGALAVVGGTFAYYNASQTFVNPFKTSNYGTVATERFNPTGDAHDWEPGETIDKKVMATNTGQGTVWVRVKLDETWKLANGTEHTITYKTSQNDFLNKFQPNIDMDGNNTHQNPKDGKVKSDEGSVVMKNLTFGTNAPTEEKDGWYYLDGYFYYTKPLAQGESTKTPLLDGVTLYKDTDMGYFRNFAGFKVAKKDAEPETIIPSDEIIAESIYDIDGNIIKMADPSEGWYLMEVKGALPMNDEGQVLAGVGSNDVLTLADDESFFTYKANKLDSNRPGYSNADYSLDITVEFVQADEEAAQSFPEAEEDWAWWPGKDATTESGAEGNVTE